jgi:multidrug efflux system outer membrane protein
MTLLSARWSFFGSLLAPLLGLATAASPALGQSIGDTRAVRDATTSSESGPAPSTSPGTLGTSGVPSGTDQGSLTLPDLPQVDDPMLRPVPPAGHALAGWEAALQLVRNQNPDVRRAQAQIEAARGQARQTLARSLPTLTGTANANFHVLTGIGPNIFQPGTVGEVPNPRGNLSTDLSLRIPLFSMQSWHDHGTAKVSVKQAEISLEEAERQVLGGLAESIAGVVTAERLAEVTRESLNSALLALELSERRARLGAVSKVDVLRAAQEVAASRSQVIEGDESLRRARETLGLSLGSSGDWGVSPGIRLDQLGQDARKVCKQTESIEQRSDLRASSALKEVANRNVKSTEYSFLPRLDGASTFTYNTNQFAAATRDHLTWTIGAVLTWNLYDGGLRYGQRESAVAARTSVRLDNDDLRRRAELEVTQALRAVLVAESQLAVSNTSRDVALENAHIAQLRFVNGTGTSFDMTETQGEARRATLDVTVKEFQLLRARIAAFLAMASCDI